MDKLSLEYDLTGKGKIEHTGYLAMMGVSDRVWFRDLRLRGSQLKECDGSANWI